MAEPILLPNHPAARARANLDALIAEARKLKPHVFSGVNWEDHRWDVSLTLGNQTNPGQRRTTPYLVFIQHNGLATKTRSSYSNQEPFPVGWADFIKAYSVVRMHERPVGLKNHMHHIHAWRWLFLGAPDIGEDLTRLTQCHFREAARRIAEHTSAQATRYGLGGYLAAISRFMDNRLLTQVATNFQNFFPRPVSQAGLKNRRLLGKHAEQDARKLPSAHVIMALAKLANLALRPLDELVVRACEILLCTGFRISELLELPVDCLQPITVPDDTGKNITRYRIGYLARKGGGWRGKWIPTAAVPLVQRAVDRLVILTTETRRQRTYIEESGFSRLWVFRHFDPDHILSTSEVHRLLALKCTKAQGVLKFLARRKIFPVSNPGCQISTPRVGSSRKFSWRVGDIEAGLIEADVDRRALIDKDGVRIQLSQSLFLVARYSGRKGRNASQHDVNVIQYTKIQEILSGVSRNSHCTPSIFDRYEIYGPNNESLSIKPHQPRHWLNMIAQEKRQLTQLEIAAFFGRKYTKDNEAYDHSGEPIDGEVVASKMMEEHDLTREQTEGFVRTFPLLDWEEAVAQRNRDIGSAHITDVGICFYDFAQSPCDRHLQCLRGCRRYERQKGNRSEIKAITKLRDRTRHALEQAEEALGMAWYGANAWVQHQEKILKGCALALSIEEKDIPDGTTVVVFPKGEDYCVEGV